MFGGSDPLADQAYDPASDTWTGLPPMPIPIPLRDSSAVEGQDGRIYILGGFSNNIVRAQVEIYDPQTGNWSYGAPMPTPRGCFQAVLGPDGRIYAAGGDDGKGG